MWIKLPNTNSGNSRYLNVDNGSSFEVTTAESTNQYKAIVVVSGATMPLATYDTQDEANEKLERFMSNVGYEEFTL